MTKKTFIRTIIANLATLVILAITIFVGAPVYAEESIGVSPMYQNMVLVPGKKALGTFTVYNPGDSTEASELEIKVEPFWQDEKNDVDFTAKEDYSRMVDWITIEEASYTLQPNERKDVAFTINVPDNAPAGGQYAAFIVKSRPKNSNGMITQIFQMAHLIYAEVAGQTTHGGEISNLQLSSFLFSGKITAGASVKNDGNIHAKTSHILRILPLFGDEELFTNEETPQENIIMPGASRYTGVTWDDTPSIGIFRANYIVEFEGVKKELSKVVIICPLWLLIVICLIIAIIIYRIVSGIIGRKDKKE